MQISILLTIKNYYVYILVVPFITILTNVINAIMAKKMYPQYTCRGNLSLDTKKAIGKNVLGLMIGKICMVSRNSFDNIFLSLFLGLTMVAMYNNYYYILTSIIGILGLVTSAISAGVGNKVALNTIEQNHKDFQLITYVYMWIAGWCTICLLCLYQPFMKLWVGEDLMFPLIVVIQLCIYFYSLSMGNMRSIYSNASGLFWQGRYYVIVEAVMNIILNYIFGKLWGVNGIIAATNITIIFINFVWGSLILYKYYFIGMNVKKYFFSQAFYAVVTCVIAVITYSAVNLIHIENWWGLILKGGVCLILPNILYLAAYKKYKYFSAAKVLLKQIVS